MRVGVIGLGTMGMGAALNLVQKGHEVHGCDLRDSARAELVAAGYDVKPLAVTPGADRNGYNFRTTVELTVPSKLKFDLTKLTPPARPADDASLENTRKGGAR
jgi:6-phosphogluconate dehydrogenase (decarboxylating)